MIRLTIQRRVFLAVFALAATLIASLLALILLPLREDFGRYAAETELARVTWLADRLEALYGRDGSWDALREAPRIWQRLSRPPDAPPPRLRVPERPRGLALSPAQAPAERPNEARDPLRIHPRLALRDVDGQVIAGNRDDKRPMVSRTLQWQGRDIGQLTLIVPPTPDRAEAGAFLATQTRHLVLAGIVATILSLLAAWWLARNFLAPLRQLADATRRIAGGKFSHRVDLGRDDELGKLAADFNSMAARLARIEETRRQWISDTSHELRTPIAVLRAEIEALQDGVRRADATTLARLHQQAERLGRLVDDLRQTQDIGEESMRLTEAQVDPLGLLADAIEDYRARYAASGLSITTTGIERGACRLRGDAGRLHQVYANLLENSLRYTDAGGSLRIAARLSGAQLELRFDDSAPAPSAAALPRLFERFFRGEASRSRDYGGSGLGLAICKTIVEAHGGTIVADLSELGGLALRLTLPLER